MIDPEVARLRRLRSEALRVRELVRALKSKQWAPSESLLDRSGCASWRIARVVSGRLRAHPYSEYQKDLTLPAHVRNRVQAHVSALGGNKRLHGLQTLEMRLCALGRQLDDAIALAWSSDFSDTLSRCQAEIKTLGASLARETQGNDTSTHRAIRPSRSDVMGDSLARSLDGDWPYLAF